MTTSKQLSVNPFELHGMACGLLCGPEGGAGAGRAGLLCELIGLEAPPPELARSMQAVLSDCHAQMAREEHDFEPLLPEDDAPLGDRTRALARWCEGFLAGFGAVAAARQRPASADQDSTLRDLAAIVEADGQGSDSEEDEWHFFEIKEYVRMAAMSFFLDGGTEDPPQAARPGPDDRVH